MADHNTFQCYEKSLVAGDDDFGKSLSPLKTPAFVYDETTLQNLLSQANAVRGQEDCDVVFSVKACTDVDVLKTMAQRLDGFSVSSLYEARLAKSISSTHSVHYTSPGIRSDEIEVIAEYCDYISFNSLSQWDRFRSKIDDSLECGIRVNPQLSFVGDIRYDPCRPNSKLGVPLDQLVRECDANPSRFLNLNGILFHSNCDSDNISQLLHTVRHISESAPKILDSITWINLGGGYLIDCPTSVGEIAEVIKYLKSLYDINVILEPGAALVRTAGFIVSSVLDIFRSEGAMVAVLDTSINHMPEVFEYDFEPDVLGHDDSASNEYLLAGCSCLAGDLFGQYRFNQELKIGDKVVFNNEGAYTMAKANMFNGIPLPSVYALTSEGNLVFKNHCTFEQFATMWGLGVDVRT